MNIILCGLQASGKTTVGKMVAEKLNWSFIDTDRLVEERFFSETGKVRTCREIMQEVGEDDFRSIEKREVFALAPYTDTVVSLGGGTLLDIENIEVLRCLGMFIYLKVDPKISFERLVKRGTPAYVDPNNIEHSFYELSKKREAVFEEYAKIIIDTTDQNIEDVVKTVANRGMYGE